MKIGIDIRLIGKKQTGSETVFFNLVKNLALIDSKNDYQLFTDILDQKIIKKIKKDLGIENKNNLKIISLETKNKFSWNFWTLPKYLRVNPIDLYLTQYITPFFVPKKIKIFTIIHDVSFRVFPKLIKLSDLFFLRTLIPLALRRAAKIIAVSQFTRNEIIKYYKIDQKKVEAIPIAVADDFLHQTFSEVELEKIRQKYKLPKKFILYLGTFQPRKNIPILIEAYTKIKNQLPEIRLVLAGGKNHNYDQQIERAIKDFELKENEVIFPGFIPEEDKKAIMLLADLFCFPSLYEGFGIPILEAFSANCPSVISDIHPHREVAGNAALFFETKSANDLAEKLLMILEENNPNNQLLANGLERLKLFSWKITTKKILQLFEKIEDNTAKSND
jgi:glycosyltransferase involved in cell wall biosynthesis